MSLDSSLIIEEIIKQIGDLFLGLANSNHVNVYFMHCHFTNKIFYVEVRQVTDPHIFALNKECIRTQKMKKFHRNLS